MHNSVFVDIIDRDLTHKDLGGGKILYLISDDTFGANDPVANTHRGIRPRWARVMATGPEVDEVQPGDLVLCDTLKWSRRIPLGRLDNQTVYFWRITVTDILLIDTLLPAEDYVRDLASVLSRIEFHIGRL